MRTRQPAQLDLRSILEASFDAQTEVPDLWALWLADTFTDSDDHARPRDGRWMWYATELRACARQNWYTCHGAERERPSMESQATWTAGKFWHAVVQFGLAVHPAYELISHEIGGWHPTLNLSARADAVFRHEGITILLEVKSEKALSGKMRRERQQNLGLTSAITPDHAAQIRATEMVVEELHHLQIDESWVLYLCKNDENIDQQQVLPSNGYDFDDGTTIVAVSLLDDLHGASEPPPPITAHDELWRCSPRSSTDPRGKWCPYREQCRGGIGS